MTEHEMEDLDFCPFCGDSPRLVERKDGKFFVWCSECSISPSTPFKKDKFEAVDIWNNRDGKSWWQTVDARWFYACRRMLPGELLAKVEREFHRLAEPGALDAVRKAGGNILSDIEG